ncbi:uncharacterized protein PV07_10278 [Cladophialophora immunda]|uniref:Transcription factor domain-containing protein n=1 Tax=Cladophialophora immunda TaxID=569365 RepID=A0A0D2C2B2_9EURO|nr:uncharacterized protein PV07_10278 [Cladophialophora immunda]KIW24570.1 hypothetical protein PV07_10278 [Cladophialophora immunda]OQV09942.1 Fungal specific transcription factor domain-containing protein [Cladophialophora immunda]
MSIYCCKHPSQLEGTVDKYVRAHRAMDRASDLDRRHTPRTNPLFPAHQQREDEDQESHRQRQPRPGQAAEQQQIPLHRRSSSLRSNNDVVRLGNPGAHELSHSPFPMHGNSFVQRAVQYYVKQYSPTTIQRPHFVGAGPDLTLLRDYIPFVMNDRMTFSALVAMASFSANIAATGSREAPSESLRFYQAAVSLLRDRLTNESQRASDAIVVTLASLCAFEAFTGNYDAVDMHTLGIKQVVALRGGTGQLGFEGYLKTVATAWQNFYAARHSISLTDPRFFPEDGNFTYPEHPFDPELCDVIARFPAGLTDIALSGTLSHQIINLVAHVNNWVHEVNVSLRDSDVYNLHDLSQSSRNVTLCGEFLHKRGLTIVEQLLVLALTAFCYSTDSTRAMFYLTNAYLQIRCKYMRTLYIEVTERNEAFMTWVSTMLLATFDPAAQPWFLGLSILRARPTLRDWQANVRISENYFWNDGLSLKLASKLGHLRGTERQGQG